jgi:hypothetical protein
MKKFPNHPQGLWTLIVNDKHETRIFTSKRKLLAWAKQNGYEVKPSYLDARTYYTKAQGIISIGDL